MRRLWIGLAPVLGAIGLAALIAPATLGATPPTPSPSPTATPRAVATPTPPARVPLPTSVPTVSSTSGLVPLPTVAAQDAPELRAVWVDAFHDGFKTPAQVDDLLTWTREANLNAIFVQVRRRGDAYYAKSIEPRTEDPALAPNFDALQYLIDRAHQGPQRIQVHAWLATLPIWHKRDTPPLAPSHAFNLRGLSADANDTWLMYRDDGSAWAGTDSGGMYYLDPGNPDVQSYTTEVYLYVVRNYDVDGVHLDQVRYYEGGPLHWGYNPGSLAAYNARYGLDPQSVPDFDDPLWIAWRRDQVSALVERIYTGVKSIRPTVAVTAAVVAWGKGPQTPDDWQRQAPYSAVLQDWQSWLQRGILDYALPMDYYRETDPQNTWFDTWTRWQVAQPGARGVAVGLGSYLNSNDEVLAQLGRARALNPLGIALYSYAVPTRDLEDASFVDRMTFASQLRSLFARPAPVPTLPSLLAASTP